jgi:hypothetical protein
MQNSADLNKLRMNFNSKFDHSAGKYFPKYIITDIIISHEDISKVCFYAVRSSRSRSLYNYGSSNVISSCLFNRHFVVNLNHFRLTPGRGLTAMFSHFLTRIFDLFTFLCPIFFRFSRILQGEF